MGADAISACIVIEEVARACASSSLIPAVNKLGSQPIILSGSAELKKHVLSDIAAGQMISYALSEREAGSDAASMRTRAVLDGDHWVLNGTKCWITNAGVSTYYTVMAVTDPEKGAKGISAFVVHKDDPGFSVGAKERKLGIKGSPDPRDLLRGLHDPGRPDHRRARHRVQDGPAHPRPHPARDRRPGARHRPGCARRIASPT